MGQNSSFIIDLSEVYGEDEDLVGKKAHELGTLRKLGIPLPDGFVITTKFFMNFLHETGIEDEIKKAQALIHPALASSIEKLFQPIQSQIMHTHIPQNLSIELHGFYRKLSGMFKNRPLNMFSSSFNNKSIVFSKVCGDANLILKIKTIWSKSFKDPVAVVIQEDIKTNVKGKVITDSPIIDRNLSKELRTKLIDYCCIMQRHFYFPKEIEYVVSNNKILVTKVNPFTGIVNGTPKKSLIKNDRRRKVLIKGISINPGIATGPVKILHNINSSIGVRKGEIAVLHDLNHSAFKKIKNAKAVIIDSILSNSLNKTFYRDGFRIPTVEGAIDATKHFQNGNVVTVNGVSGEIYSGGLIY